MKNKLKYWGQPSDQEELKRSLLNNATSITTTDTILGLLAPITEEGFFNLNEIKGERENKPYLILIGTSQKLDFFVQGEKLTIAMSNIITNCWPGPLTIIFPAQPNLPFYLKSSQETIALRCPNHKGLLQLLTDFDGLFSTSANRSGKPTPKTLKEIPALLIKKVAYVVIDETESSQSHQPSTIIDFSEAINNPATPIRIIREGAYPIKELEKYYGAAIEK
jgi:tRNA threonylcarbamoyl adenosine modification protein (Sua5/YciO/YrdC/YwlC family)